MNTIVQSVTERTPSFRSWLDLRSQNCNNANNCDYVANSLIAIKLHNYIINDL